MLIRNRRRWELKESEATPESAYLNRRQLAAGLAAGAIVGAAGLGAAPARAQFLGLFGGSDPDPAEYEVDPTAELYPFTRNMRYATLDRDLTPEDVNGRYNNFYEFGSHKEIWQEAQKLPLRPWAVTFDGMVEEERTVDFDTLMKAMPLEERLYRHRCVEAWSMTIPWSGFALKALVDYARPLGSAKYLRMETFHKPEVASGQKQAWYPWPYVEGLTIAEATNELAFIATGTYGKPMPKQHGAPLRLAVPWKYGFKSIKSLVRLTFTEERPVSFWEELQAAEYGFWANVNPEVDHPRWTQATERVLHTGERVPTLLYNGYEEEVAHLYKDMEQSRALFM